MIQVLQATAWYPPHYLGGTEVYLTGLVRGLRSHDVESQIVTPLARQAPDSYVYDDTVVHTYPVNQETTRAELRGHRPHEGFSRFCEILSESRPDVYHQHSWTRGLGSHHLQAARRLGIKTVLTIHTPNVTCIRGTMMHFGETPCDGEIKVDRCAACWCQARGSSKQVSRLLAGIPGAVGTAFEAAGLSGRLTTALSSRNLAAERRNEFAKVIDNADRIVAVCQWLYDALARNNVPEEKLVLSRQGVDDAFAEMAKTNHKAHLRETFRLAYIGRWHPVKGVDKLIKAMLAIPENVPLELVVYGLGSCLEEPTYEELIRELAAQDSRIRIAPPVPRERLLEALRDADALAVPSVWLETGPLVVLEAQATGLPVIGSRIGGIAELVREPEDGILVETNSVEAWSQAIVTFSQQYLSSERRRDARTVRTMSAAAQDMATLYRSLS